MAGEKVHFEGLPARICWLGYGERHLAGLRFNEMVASGELQAPIVIGRDHLDCRLGRLARTARPRRCSTAPTRSPTGRCSTRWSTRASGASWVSIHHGGGVGIGRSIHAGQVTRRRRHRRSPREKLERVLTNDPGTGVMRHVDAGYDRAERGRGRARRADPDAGGRLTRYWAELRLARRRSGAERGVLIEVDGERIASGRAPGRSAAGDAIAPARADAARASPTRTRTPSTARCAGAPTAAAAAFWTWREDMYAVAERLDPDSLPRARPRDLRRDGARRDHLRRRVPLPPPRRRRHAATTSRTRWARR